MRLEGRHILVFAVFACRISFLFWACSGDIC